MAPWIKPLGLTLASILQAIASPTLAQPAILPGAEQAQPQAPYILHVSDVHLNASS